MLPLLARAVGVPISPIPLAIMPGVVAHMRPVRLSRIAASTQRLAQSARVRTRRRSTVMGDVSVAARAGEECSVPGLYRCGFESGTVGKWSKCALPVFSVDAFPLMYGRGGFP